MKPVTIYSTNYCPYCRRAKDLLAKRNIPFTEVDLTHDAAKRQELEAKTGWMSVPMIFIGEKFIGGSDDLYELDRTGKLKALLQES